MAVIEEFVVRKPFDYAGEHYAQGDVWEPGGYRHDNSLIEHRFVWKRRRPVESSGGDYDALMDKTNNELRELLKERGLPVHGAKAELVNRLMGSND